MMMKKMCGVHKVAWLLLIVGGLNWLVVGIAGQGFDVFSLSGLGMGSVIARAVYILIGLSALSMFGLGKCCMKGGCMCGGMDKSMAMKPCACGSGKKAEDCCMKSPETQQKV